VEKETAPIEEKVEMENLGTIAKVQVVRPRLSPGSYGGVENARNARGL